MKDAKLTQVIGFLKQVMYETKAKMKTHSVISASRALTSALGGGDEETIEDITGLVALCTAGRFDDAYNVANMLIPRVRTIINESN